MSIANISMLMVAAVLGSASSALAQMPDGLRAAMRARDIAFYAVIQRVIQRSGKSTQP